MLVFVTVLAVSSYWPDAENEYEDDFTLDAVFYPELDCKYWKYPKVQR